MSRLLGTCSAGAVRQVVCFDERIQAEIGRPGRFLGASHRTNRKSAGPQSRLC